MLGLCSSAFLSLTQDASLMIEWRPGDHHDAHYEDLFTLSHSTSSIKIVSRPSAFIDWIRLQLARLLWLIYFKSYNTYKSSSLRIPTDFAFFWSDRWTCPRGPDNSSAAFFEWLLSFNRITWMRTDQYFVPLLTHNPQLHSHLASLFPENVIFPKLLKLVAWPAKNIILNAAQMSKFIYSRHPNTSTIGIHFRGFVNADAHLFQLQKIMPQAQVVVITGESFAALEKLLHLFPKYFPTHSITIHTNLLHLHPVSMSLAPTPIRPRYTLDVYIPRMNGSAYSRDALADALLLAAQDILFMTGMSTFSMLAHGYQQIIHEILSVSEKKRLAFDIYDGHAILLNSSEPLYEMSCDFPCVTPHFLSERILLHS